MHAVIVPFMAKQIFVQPMMSGNIHVSLLSFRHTCISFEKTQTAKMSPCRELKKQRRSKMTSPDWLLTLQTAACRMASNPPSGASLLRETICFCTSSLKRSTLSVRDKRWRKPNVGTQFGNNLYLK